MRDGAEQVHVRTIRMEVTRAAPDTLDVRGRLCDERPEGGGWFGIEQGTVIHDMTVTLRVRHPDLVITGVAAEMAARPYTICSDAVGPLQQLVGLSVARGFTRAVNERFGRQQGCAHLTALIQAMAPVIRQGATAAFRDQQDLPRADGDLWFVNTCQAWRENGLLHSRLLAGDIEGLKALSARPAGPSGA